MAAVMTVSGTSVFANPSDVTLSGTSTVVAPIYSILLPTAPVISVNPFQIGARDDDAAPPQVSSPVYVIANRSNIPVLISAEFIATTTSGTAPNQPAQHPAIFVDNDNAGAISNSEETTKHAFLYVEFATTFTVSDAFTNRTSARDAAAIAWTFPNTDTNHMRTLKAAPADAVKVGMILDAHPYNYDTGSGRITDANMALTQVVAYRFGGAVAPFATWGANNVAARIVFSFEGIRNETDLAAYRTHSTAGGALNVYNAVAKAAP